ncbi:MAG: hypothetical protein ACLFU8_14870 [Anaerolineales bacterium]
MLSELHTKPAWYYEFRVTLGAAALLPLLGLPAFALLQWLFIVSDGQTVEAYNLVRAFELLLPLTVGLAAAQLMSVERDEGMAELRLSYPEDPWRLPLVRTGVALLIGAVAIVLGLVAFRWVFDPIPPGALVEPALGPTLFLLGLALLVGNLTGNYWLAAALVMGYWFFEVQTQGDVTKSFFLFQYAWPVEAVDYVLNRRLLAGVGGLFLLVNAWLSARRKRGKGWRPRGDR